MSNYEATKYDFSGANLTGIEGIPFPTFFTQDQEQGLTSPSPGGGTQLIAYLCGGGGAAERGNNGAGDGATTFLVLIFKFLLR